MILPLCSLELPEDPLAFHEPLNRLCVPVEMPYSAYTEMKVQFRDGLEHDGPTYERQWELSANFEPVVASLLRGAFLVGCASRGLDRQTGRFDGIAQVFLCCAGIKQFGRAFLGMTSQDLERAFVAAKHVGAPQLATSIVGALCEARTASALIEAGLTVLESTTDEDVNLGVDLIVPNGQGRGWLIQAKSRRDSSLLDLIAIGDDNAARETHEKTWKFNHAYGVLFAPVRAQVGTESGGLFRIRHPNDIESVERFFRSLRDPP